MTNYAERESLAAKFADIERRLANLETAPTANQSSLKDGRITVLDASGRTLLEMGHRTDDPTSYGFTSRDPAIPAQPIVTEIGGLAGGGYGLRVKSQSGRELLTLDDIRGQASPQFVAAAVAPLLYARTTKTTGFDDIWKIRFHAVSRTLNWDLNLDPVASSASWQLVVNAVDGAANGFVLASGSVFAAQNVAASRSLADALSGADQLGRLFDVRLQMQRTGGADAVGASINTPFYLSP